MNVTKLATATLSKSSHGALINVKFWKEYHYTFIAQFKLSHFMDLVGPSLEKFS